MSWVFPQHKTNTTFHQKLNGTESQRTRKKVTRAIKYPRFRGPWTVGPVGDFLETWIFFKGVFFD